MRKTIFAILAGVALLMSSLVSPANAATRASVSIDGSRVVVTFTGKKPKKARMLVGGASYKLTRSGKAWRTKPMSSQQLAALAGQKAKLRITVGGKKRTVNATVPVTQDPGTPPPGGGTPPPGGGTPPPGGGAPAPLFTAPGVDSTGNPAWEAVKGYFYNSTLTDCPAGWPNCPVEERYGIFADNTQWYCRLTLNSQSDIRSVSTLVGLVGAEQKADGSWGVSYQVNSYDNLHQYTVRVAANGSAIVQWWGSGADFSGPPSEVKTGLQWMRGAKDCSY